MNTMISILIIVTSFTNMNQNHKTGVWLEEFTVPYNEFSNKGYKITVASITGGDVPIDSRSLPTEKQAKEWEKAINALKNSVKISEIDSSKYDAVFIPGGHGAMFDLPNDLIVKNVIEDFANENKLIASVCHGPEDFVPGFTDNYVSNEMIIKDLDLEAVWENLVNTASWTKYYSNMADVEFYYEEGTHLKENTRFKFKTFGFPIEAKITEFVLPFDGEPARIAWHGWNETQNLDERINVIHAWLIEELTGNRVRVLTQETQNGKPAEQLAKTRPNHMLNGHQEWLDGLISYSSKN